MKAKLKYLNSPDIADLENFSPEDSSHFGFLLQLLISPKEQEGEEMFSIQVCTPMWLLLEHGKEGVVFGRHLLIVFEYNYERILNKIVEYVEHLEEPSWESLADKISRIGFWEFEDYRSS